jgi:hypothetical protein
MTLVRSVFAGRLIALMGSAAKISVPAMLAKSTNPQSHIVFATVLTSRGVRTGSTALRALPVNSCCLTAARVRNADFIRIMDSGFRKQAGAKTTLPPSGT